MTCTWLPRHSSSYVGPLTTNKFGLFFLGSGHDSLEQPCQGSDGGKFLPGRALNPKQALSAGPPTWGGQPEMS